MLSVTILLAFPAGTWYIEDLRQAARLLDESFKGMSTDYVITEVKETKVMDVIVHGSEK